MNSRDIRRSFLDFFERHGHRIVPSSSLVPADDPTLLFTNAGMNQFKDVFLGRERRDYVRAVSSQTCMRVSGKHNDLDNVGPSLRHHTFFEMLGNFSFGDYFKEEAIRLAWTLLTDVWQLPPERLFATVFSGEAGIPWDEDAWSFWLSVVPENRIAKLGLADNFWSMGDTGPCGRCSEIHFYRGDDIPCPEPACLGPACSCDRFVEVWNNVFMEFDRQPDGTLRPLPAPSIDTGMGLERITAVIGGTLSNYDTDLFQPLIAALADRLGVRYGDAGAAATPAGTGAPRPFTTDDSLRAVADHVRATTFLIGDGVMPSNEWRGYVLRKIMRRAMRHGKRLGATEPFLFGLSAVVIDEMRGAYPDLERRREAILQVVRGEEERFDAVLTAGLGRLEDVLDRAASGSRVVAGEDIFRLYDSLGLPPDFTEDLASERGLAIDRDGFERAMAAQRERARVGSAFEAKAGTGFHVASESARRALDEAGDQFDGYAGTRVDDVPVVAVFDADRRQIERLEAGQSGFVVLGRTPFYVEAGGQVSDVGRLEVGGGTGSARVEGMARLQAGGPRVHRVHVESGAVAEGDTAAAEVDAGVRDATRRNHTATHLLHAALRQVLGAHVTQAGSLVAPDRLRFDFARGAALSEDEINRIERLVNEHIYRNSPVLTDVRNTEEAIAAGAMALFGEKYGDRVRVVSVPGVSVELCGGTHCRATGDIGSFTIVEESGIAAGVRRIEALTGAGAIEYQQRRRARLDEALAALNAGDDQVADAIRRLQSDAKRLKREVDDLKLKAALGSASTPAHEAIEVAGVKLISQRVDGLDRKGLRSLSDSLRGRLESGIVILASEMDGKVAIVVSVSPDLSAKVPAGQIVRRIAPVVGGGGGGRSDFAEAGGHDPARIDDMLAEGRRVVGELAGK